MKDGYSICFNEWALDKDIKNELGLLVIISSLCAEKGYCYASNKYFAELFYTTEETISRKIKLLEEKQYINIEYEKRGCQVKLRKLRLTKISIDDYQKYQSTIDKNVKENNISNNNTSNNNIYKQKFEELWKMYPNKKGKENAYKSFIKAIKDGTDIEIIKQGIEKYNEYIKNKKIEDQYIKHGSTWFNQKCWEDDYTIINNNVPKWFYQDFNSKKEEKDMFDIFNED